MIKTMTPQWWAVMPEIILSMAAIVVMLMAVVPVRISRVGAPLVSFGACIAAIAIAANQFSKKPLLNAWAAQIDSDKIANIARILVAAAGAVAVLYSIWIRKPDGRDVEHYSLLLLAVAGMGLFAAAGSLLTLFIGLELFSLALYVLCALEAERVSSLEAGLKYLIVGGLSSAFLLYGCALVYGDAGSLDLHTIGSIKGHTALFDLGAAMMLIALAFKASAAPVHWWTPDVYDGAPTSITAFMASATKVAALLATARVLVVAFPQIAHQWEMILAGIATASIVVGNVAALAQTNLKRLLAYSSIAHAGYLIVGLVAWNHGGIAALGYASAVYAAMTLGAFALIILREKRIGRAVTINDLRGTGWGSYAGGGSASWLVGIAMTITMLSLAGIPPTAGFFSKFGLFQSAVEADYAWLAFVGVLGSVVSLGYYLRVIVVMYMQPEVDTPRSSEATSARTPWVEAFGVAAVAASLALAFAPGWFIDRTCEGADSLLKQSSVKSAHLDEAACIGADKKL